MASMPSSSSGSKPATTSMWPTLPSFMNPWGPSSPAKRASAADDAEEDDDDDNDIDSLTPEQLEARQARMDKRRLREMEAQRARPRPSKLQQLRDGYESLVCAVVRPPRSRYSMEKDLGPRLMRLDSGIEMAREDFTLENNLGHALQCSIWTPIIEPELVSTAVVYLHGNSSCRVDATRTGVLETVGPLHAALVALDFAGSGLSGGDYVTLGWHEQHDVATVVRHLVEKRGFLQVGLWGRSMGAVAALLFAQNPLYPELRPATLVLDSPFCSFPKLVDDLIKKGAIKVPRFAVHTVLGMVRSSVKKRTGADIFKLEPIKGCPESEMPALFVTADRDEMIPTEHGSLLNSDWGGPSLQVTFRGGHNSPRPPHIYDAAGTFLRAVLESSDKGAAGCAEAVKAAFASIQGLCEDSPGDLPPGWLSATDPETGDTYYYDTYTHKTTWFRPYKPSEGHNKSDKDDDSGDEKPTASKGRGPMSSAGSSSDGPASAQAAQSKAATPSVRKADAPEFGAFSGYGSPGAEDALEALRAEEGGASVVCVEAAEDDLSPAHLEALMAQEEEAAYKGNGRADTNDAASVDLKLF